ncbi:MAG: glycosyltransferase [Acidobacteriota bacterium]|nr:glycosyltransferase [Acidobacteriota bacterium]
MKVCVITYKACWQDESGCWLSSGGFPLQMRGIASLFDEMTLVTVGVEGGTGGVPLPGNARIIPMEGPSGKDLLRKISVIGRSGYYLPRIISAVREADVVHTPLPGDLPLLGMLVAVVYRKKLFVRYESSWSPNSQTTLGNRITRALVRCFASKRNVMFVTGEGAVRPAPRLEWLFATSLSQHELDAVTPQLDKGLSDPPRIVYFGRLSTEKGVLVLLKAIGLLRQQGLILEAAIVGDGPERDFLENQARQLGCQSLVRFTGQLGREPLAHEAGMADFCVQPSFTEGYSKAWLDAMAFGLPVMSSEVGAARAVIGEEEERGWLVPPGDSGALAARLRDVVNEKRDWGALRRRCRAYVETRTLEAWTERIATRCGQSWGLKRVQGRFRT